jgi:hypothetical protein
MRATECTRRSRAVFHTGHATRRGQHACDPARSCLVLRFSDDSGRELRSFAPFRGLGFMLHDATQGLRPGLTSYAPPGLGMLARLDPRLTPWARVLRPSGAGSIFGCNNIHRFAPWVGSYAPPGLVNSRAVSVVNLRSDRPD